MCRRRSYLIYKIRLLDSRNLKLREFTPEEVPPYRILSHTVCNLDCLFSPISRLLYAKYKIF